MCVGFWCLDDPEYSLVLCTNRDEYLSRPTAPAHWHSFESLKSSALSKGNGLEGKSGASVATGEAFILSGRDTLAGGTWVGINKRGEVALLTNITEPAANMPSSRGHLCSSFLCRNASSINTDMFNFVTELISSDVRYSGFNLLLLAPSNTSHIYPNDQNTSLGKVHYEARFLSNGGAGNPIASYPIPQQPCGCNGISNGVPNGAGDPFTGKQSRSEWPKVVQGSTMLSDIIATHEKEDILVERLFKLLRNKTDSPPETRQAFQEMIMIDPVDARHLLRGPSFAQAHGPVDNIVNNDGDGRSVLKEDETRPDYFATRLSTVLLVRRTGEVLFIERDVWLSGTNAKAELTEHFPVDTSHERRFRFQVGGCEHRLSINPVPSALRRNPASHAL